MHTLCCQEPRQPVWLVHEERPSLPTDFDSYAHGVRRGSVIQHVGGHRSPAPVSHSVSVCAVSKEGCLYTASHACMRRASEVLRTFTVPQSTSTVLSQTECRALSHTVRQLACLEGWLNCFPSCQRSREGHARVLGCAASQTRLASWSDKAGRFRVAPPPSPTSPERHARPCLTPLWHSTSRSRLCHSSKACCVSAPSHPGHPHDCPIMRASRFPVRAGLQGGQRCADVSLSVFVARATRATPYHTHTHTPVNSP